MSGNETFFSRNEFLIRRLHSLSGLIPVGAYMCVHLVTNASILNGAETFQNAVYQIHSLGNILWIVEWLFIFLPILFHALFGVVIIYGGKNNVSRYRYGSNVRYYLQRITGMVALLFIFVHVFHLHGWFHIDFWIETIVKPLNGAQFLPYRAASTTANALQGSLLLVLFYAVGILSCVFHFANGIWTMGITWGIWTSPAGQKRAGYIAAGVGGLLTVISLSALIGFYLLDVDKARETEKQMYEDVVRSKRFPEAPHKYYGHSHSEEPGESGDENADPPHSP